MKLQLMAYQLCPCPVLKDSQKFFHLLLKEGENIELNVKDF